MTYDWDAILRGMLAAFREDETTDREDRAVQAVLLALHEAIDGQIDLTDLAMTVIDFARPGHYFTDEGESRRARQAEQN